MVGEYIDERVKGEEIESPEPGIPPVPPAHSPMLYYAMTAKEILDMNGDFIQNPLLDTLHRLDTLFTVSKIPYAVIGGLAVVRNGAHRTTMDIDILIGADDWNRYLENPPGFLEVGPDYAKDLYALGELLKARGAELKESDYSTMPQFIASTLKHIYRKVRDQL